MQGKQSMATGLGLYVRAERKLRLKLSLEGAAAKWDMSVSSLSRIEAGLRTRLYPETMQKLSQGLDVPVDTLYRMLAEANGQEEARTRPGAGNKARKTSKATS